MELYGVLAKIFAMSKAYYRSITSQILAHKKSTNHSISDLVFDNVVSRRLFCLIAPDYILRRILQGSDGVEVAPGRRLTDLDYVDEFDLLAPRFGDLRSLILRNRWCQLRDKVQSTTLDILSRTHHQHHDCFDDKNAAISNLLIEKNRLHKAYVDRPTNANKKAFYRKTEVLERTGLPSIYVLSRKLQLHYSGHLERMDNERLPNQLFYGYVATGYRRQGCQERRYKGILKTSLKQLQVNPANWEDIAWNRPALRRSENRISNLPTQPHDRRQSQMRSSTRMAPSDASRSASAPPSMSINHPNGAPDLPSPSFNNTSTSTAAATAPAPTTKTNKHDAPLYINPTSVDTRDVDSVSPVHTATAPSPHASAWSVIGESVARRLPNRYQEHYDTTAAPIRTAQTVRAHSLTTWAKCVSIKTYGRSPPAIPHDHISRN
ncbi:unnamed protein product [Schistocephalus solidus]|uniref:Uncharacterized protein n=1 Tax=Schistocephalus solidus TaxID=70667 RepID=A0A183T2K0_SCHSO|nr:unnamed protein product [Schistocephalus solidus]